MNASLVNDEWSHLSVYLAVKPRGCTSYSRLRDTVKTRYIQRKKINEQCPPARCPQYRLPKLCIQRGLLPTGRSTHPFKKARPTSLFTGGSCCLVAPVLPQVLPYLRIGGIALSTHDLPNTIKMIQWFEFGTLVKTHVAFNKPR